MLSGFVAGILGAILFRIRGGLFDAFIGDSTQIARLIWAIPSAVLIYAGTTPDTEFLWRVGLLILSFWMSLVLFGHGAHMVISFDAWKEEWAKGNTPDDTENLTWWWLPSVFDGKPTKWWSEGDFVMFHISGMGCIGVVRNFLATLPILFISPGFALMYTISGALHGVMYYIGWQLPNIPWVSRYGSQNGELLVGFLSWFTIGYVLYV